MADDFLAENNHCGQHILQLVSRGNAIIAELLRLKDYIPPVFRWDRKQDHQKYGDIISDFAYFKASDEFDRKIETNPQLQDLDDEFRENHIEILSRFYSAFENIQKFAVDLNNFIDDLDDGVYIQQSLETIMLNIEGKQLLCESVYLYGVMLMVVDLHVTGEVRERILVSYYRYTAERSTSGSNIDDVCKLLRSTCFTPEKRPLNYPEDFFRRTPLREQLVSLVIGRLRTDDIYNQISAYPYTEHRSTALANQAAMLYVCLYFQPNILHNQTARMRETVDKYFPDNWVISVYMGLTVNLVDAWEPYKAARMALANTLDSSNVMEQAELHAKKFEQCMRVTQQKLKAGGLTKANVLERVDKVVNIIRTFNVTLRWLMLHTANTCCVSEPTKKSKQIRETIAERLPKHAQIFQLLLDTSEFELRIKELFKTLLLERESEWVKCKKESTDRLNELAKVFSGENPLIRVEKNDNLGRWFTDIANQISQLNIEEPSVVGRKIVQLIRALEEVQGFTQLFSNHLIVQFLTEIKQFLHQMVQGSNIKETVLINLQIIGDLSYAWNIIDNFTNLMQSSIKKEPSLVSKLRATFLKLSSAMEIPLLRINQAQSPDLVSVSQYYSHELVSYIRSVVQIIPETMFKLMAEIVHLQTHVINELPTRLDKDKLKEFAQLNDRLRVAKLTHQVSVFTEGVLRMKSTLVGIVRIDPKQLLEDGIRKELVHHLATALDSGLKFDPKAKPSDVGEKLQHLGEIMDGHRRSFEYIQDYIDIYGLKIWQEELSRVIGFSVDMECNSFLRVKMHEWQSVHQNKAIPIPVFTPSPTDPQSVNFIGRLARQLIRITDPKTTVYAESAVAWFDLKTQKVVADLKFFSKIQQSVSTSGLTGLDRLISFMIVTELQNFLSSLHKSLHRDKACLEHLTATAKAISPNTANISNPNRVYPNASNKLQKMWSQYLDCVLHIGQLQLLRKHIFYELRTACKFESKPLASALETMNQALLNEIKIQYKSKGPRTDSDNANLLGELTTYMDWAGIGNVLAKIYVTTKNLNFFSLFSFLFIISQLQKLVFDKNIGLVWKKSGEAMDGVPFVIGLQTIFRHFNPQVRSQLLLYLAQYVNSYVESSASAGMKLATVELPPEVTVTLQFLTSFAKYSGLPRSALTQHIPEPILDLFQYEML